MKKIKRSLFFNLFLASIVIMNIMVVYSQVKKPAEEPPAYEDEKKDTVSAENVEDKPQDMTAGTIDSFMEEYRHAVEHIRELQPDAAIFLCGIMHVKKEKSESDPIFSNENISQRNERISELADNKSIFYVDINELVVDKDGNLLPEYTYDEVHLLGKYYSLLSDCLLEHAVEWP